MMQRSHWKKKHFDNRTFLIAKIVQPVSVGNHKKKQGGNWKVIALFPFWIYKMPFRLCCGVPSLVYETFDT